MDGSRPTTSDPRRSADGSDRDEVGALPPEVDAADRLLITGPPMTGKYAILLRYLVEYGDLTLFVSTDRAAAQVRADQASVAGSDPGRSYVVDCSGTDEGGGEQTRTASPGNLTEVGVAFTAIADALQVEDATPAVGVHSLSHFLSYQATNRVDRFVRTLSTATTDRGWPFAAVLSSTVHDEQVHHALHEPFDCLLETRVAGEDREFRVRPVLESPSAWRTF